MFEVETACAGVLNHSNPLRGLRFNPPLQTPKDPYHLLIHGWVLQLMVLIYNVSLSADQRQEFNTRLNSFQYPPSLPRITFDLGKKIGRRWGFAVYRSLIIISPYLLVGLVESDVLECVLDFIEFYYLAFSRTLTAAGSARAMVLAKSLVRRVSQLFPYSKERNWNMGQPTLHSIIELAREMSLFGNAGIIGAQREEARHALPKGDLFRTNRRNVAVRLAKLDAAKVGKIYILHGGRFSGEGRIDAVGQRRCGDGVLNFCDPANPMRPHPLVAMLTSYSTFGPAFSTHPTRVQHFVRQANPLPNYFLGSDSVLRKRLSAAQFQYLRGVYEQRGMAVPDQERLYEIRMAKQLVVRDRLYRIGEDVLIDSGGAQPFVGRVEEIASHHPLPDVVIPLLFVRWLRPVREPRSERPKTAMRRQVLLADSSVEPLPVLSESVIGKTAAFHHCAFPGLGPRCMVTQERVCHQHETMQCALCPPNSGTLVEVFSHSNQNRHWLWDELFIGD